MTTLSKFKMDYIKNQHRPHIVHEKVNVNSWDLFRTRVQNYLNDPSEIYEEGMESPTAETLQLALNVMNDLEQRGLDSPYRVVPDAHGSIVLEFIYGQVSEFVFVKNAEVVNETANDIQQDS